MTSASDAPFPSPRLVRARRPARLRAQLSELRELWFERADPAEDLPAFIRSASGVRKWQGYFAIVQDDVHAIALLDPETQAIEPVLLPRAEDGRRVFGDDTDNKALKMDLEACAVLPDGRFMAMGSGSYPARERLVLLTPEREVEVVEADDLYALLHRRVDFSGSELNVEGAEIIGDSLRLFQRGNGAPRDGLEPVNAFADLDLEEFMDWLGGAEKLPTLGRATQVDLGEAAGVQLDFTDCGHLGDGRVAFLGAAEDSPDAYQDGENVGCCFGLVDGEEIIICDILTAQGERSTLKFEGIEYLGEDEAGRMEFVVVVDSDDQRAAAPIARLYVTMGAD